MHQIAPIKVFSFNSADAVNLNTIESVRDYAINRGLVNIEPTYISDIRLEITHFNNATNTPHQRLRVFYFKSLVAYQSEILHFYNNVGIGTFSTTEGTIFGKERFLVDSIGFAPENNSIIGGTLEIKVKFYKA